MFHLSMNGAGFCLLLESANLSPWFLLSEGGGECTEVRATVPRQRPLDGRKAAPQRSRPGGALGKAQAHSLAAP